MARLEVVQKRDGSWFAQVIFYNWLSVVRFANGNVRVLGLDVSWVWTLLSDVRMGDLVAHTA